MERLVEFLIPYKGLSIGKHDYQFHVDKSFFTAVESEAVDNGDLNVNLTIDRQSRMIIANLSIEGYIKLICDRCLEEFDFNINLNYEQIYKFGDSPDEKEDDIIYLGDSDFQLDISHLILENILLQIPIRRVHENDKLGNPKCGKEQLDLIEGYTRKKQVDPRWDALKDLKFDD